MKRVKYIVATLIGILAPATVVLAVVHSLNGQTGQTQTFADDLNITITSNNNVHMLGWNGTLPVSRGGTGTSTIPQDGYILIGNGTGYRFIASSSLSGNGPSFFNATGSSNQVLVFTSTNTGIGYPGLTFNGASTLQVGGTATATIRGDSSANGTASYIPYLYLGNNADGGSLAQAVIWAGRSDDALALIKADQTSKWVFGWDSNVNDFCRGDFCLTNIGLGDQIDFVPGRGNAFGQNGGGPDIGLGMKPVGGYSIEVDSGFRALGVSSLASTSFAGNVTTTNLQVLNGSSSTLSIGDVIHSGCIVMGDYDGGGLTYITTYRGMLLTTTTKPNVCR